MYKSVYFLQKVAIYANIKMNSKKYNIKNVVWLTVDRNYYDRNIAKL